MSSHARLHCRPFGVLVAFVFVRSLCERFRVALIVWFGELLDAGSQAPDPRMRVGVQDILFRVVGNLRF